MDNQINIVEGDLVEATLSGVVDCMLHVTNDVGVMGSGIALQVRNKIPSAFTNYKASITNMQARDIPALGTVSTSDDNSVINLTCQHSFGKGIRHIHYGELIHCLTFFRDYITPHMDISSTFLGKPFPIVGMPYLMGADRAGGDWDTVYEITQAILGEKCDLVVYKFNPNAQ